MRTPGRDEASGRLDRHRSLFYARVTSNLESVWLDSAKRFPPDVSPTRKCDDTLGDVGVGPGHDGEVGQGVDLDVTGESENTSEAGGGW